MAKALNLDEVEEAVLITALMHYYLTELTDMPPSAMKTLMAKSLASACEEIQANLEKPIFNWTGLYDQLMEMEE